MTNTDIIKTAYKVWGREFYSHTSLRSLAAELGVSKPALYRHFITKNALFEAMLTYFYDDFCAFIKTDYEKVLKNNDKTESIFLLIRTVSEYYARNLDLFIYSMVKLHEQKAENSTISEKLRARGIDFSAFQQSINTDYSFDPLIMRLLFATLTFYMAGFHKHKAKIKPSTERQGYECIDVDSGSPPDEAAISKTTGAISAIIGAGLGYIKEEIDSLNYEGLENRITGTADHITDDSLLNAVAGAVAEAGPWEASMKQVARRSGLSKSSLYSHFKSRHDMLQRLFITESLRIFDFARQGIRQSAAPLEQLYLGVFSIAEYLRSRPDILVALDWMRNRRFTITGSAKKPPEYRYHTGPAEGPAPEMESLRIFDEIDIKPLLDNESPFRVTMSGEKVNIGISPWILFLIVNTLMRKNQGQPLGEIPNEDIRSLFRFITLGIKGFKK
jgi:AcrR family transcriptional regulator